MAGEQHFQIGIKGLIRNKQGQILMVFIPEWGHNPPHWDFPGGRMDPGESFLDTLKRELQEELGVTYVGEPQQFGAVLTNITIPVGDVLMPLVFVVYQAQLPEGSTIVLDPNGRETEYGWFEPADAAEKMAVKFTPDFCEQVRALQ
jgi:8-oxo-dGTP diphosphatase